MQSAYNRLDASPLMDWFSLGFVRFSFSIPLTPCGKRYLSESKVLYQRTEPATFHYLNFFFFFQ